MPEIADWHAYLAKQETRKRAEKERERLVSLPQMKEVTHKAQTVLDHPGWQHFADALETRMSEIKASRAQFAERMVNGSEMGAQLELLKLNVNKCDAELAGLQYAVSLIPQTIALGQRIAGEMSGQVAVASADH